MNGEFCRVFIRKKTRRKEKKRTLLIQSAGTFGRLATRNRTETEREKELKDKLTKQRMSERHQHAKNTEDPLAISIA